MENFKIFINFKTYPQGTGEKAVELAKLCEEILHLRLAQVQNDSKNVEIIPIVQVVDLYRIKQAVKIPVWVQHLDWQPQGKFNGWINLEAVIEAGAGGTLVNHSEHQIPPGTIKQILARISKSSTNTQHPSPNTFQTMVCCKTLGQMERLVKFKPDYIAYEIAELIGTRTSICEMASKQIKHAVEICGKIPLIVGAGVNSKKDLEVAKKLGAKGALISSAIVLDKNPKEKLLELIE